MAKVWNVGDKAIYVAGDPLWRDYIGSTVEVIHTGTASDGIECATIIRRDTGDAMKVRADEKYTNIRPIDVLADTAALLTKEGLTVTIEYPGYLSIWAEDLGQPMNCWNFGTANETWDGDLVGADGQPLGHVLSTQVPSKETDPAVIAAAIIAALEGGL